jgi:hypothetical protein
MRPRSLTNGAAAITLTLVSFLIFRGMTNLVNSITIPLIFLFFTGSLDQQSRIAVGVAMLFAVLFLFPAQILFTLIYLGMAILLIYILGKDHLIQLLYPILVTGLLIFGVNLTDKLFLTEINAFMVHLSGGKLFVYILIFFIESLLISGLHFFFYRNILHRSKHLNQRSQSL